MINRRLVQCPGCKEKITLRLSIGPTDRQPFYYVCGSCNAATRGVVDASSPPTVGLELEDGTELFEDIETVQVITIDSTIPHVPGTRSMAEMGGSPFMHMFQSLGGDRLFRLKAAYQDFPQLVEQNAKQLDRLARYYLDRNWPAFDAGLTGLWPVDNPPQRVWHRHDLFHRLFDLLSAKVREPDGAYPRMKAEWNKLALPSDQTKSLWEAAVVRMSTSQELVDVQENLFECLRLYIQNHQSWMPGFAISLLPRPREEYGELRVYRDDFPVLRDLYIRTFEACHSALDLLVPLINLAVRGNESAFPAPTEVKRPVTSAAQFRKLPAFQKQFYLSDLPEWNELWPTLLDRSVRNAIGHASIRHDLRSGSLRSREDDDLPYPDFLAKTHQLIHPLLAVTNAVKIPLIHASMCTGT